ncbi:fungal-specific transcription factor domain-containing protein [Xylogone sp. PMI_703]|nr:fungal-specific transcription factor domain-containing protein [Xylogone sp. PMI_703]
MNRAQVHSAAGGAPPAAHHDTNAGGIPSRISRRRPQLTCVACRRRKLKCDRSQPCVNCVRRDEGDSCAYLSFNPKQNNSKDSERTRTKLDRLEKLVLGLIDTVKQNDSNVSGGISDGRVNENGQSSKSNIMTSSLWEDVLQDVTEIRDYFNENDSYIQEQITNIEYNRPDFTDTKLVFGGHENVALPTLLALLPPRSEADRLVANFFRYSFVLRPTIHPRKFEREYERFWLHPLATPIAWMGLLFSMLRISSWLLLPSITTSSPSPNQDSSAVTNFRTGTIECLSSIDFSKPGPYILEALLLHIEAEFMSSPDSRVDTWILTSTAVRSALCSGLHREPSLYKDISPFDAEMRRRLWLGIEQCDIMMSFQVGLPAMIPRQQVTTRPPQNLRDDDFDEDDCMLPPSRSMNEVTDIAFFLAKQPLLEAFAKIALYSQDTRARDEELAVLQAELDHARDNLPMQYRLRPLSKCLTESSLIILRRYAIDQIYQTGVCVLHRRHLTRAQSDSKWSSSRRACIDAALTLLSFQFIKYEETRPGGRFTNEKFLMNSLDQNSFLLAAMLICLDLRSRNSLCRESSDIVLWRRNRGKEMSEALQTSAKIWNCLRDTSSQAFKASEASAVILRNLANIDNDTDITATEPELEIQDTMPSAEVFSIANDVNWIDFDHFFYDQFRS